MKNKLKRIICATLVLGSLSVPANAAEIKESTNTDSVLYHIFDKHSMNDIIPYGFQTEQFNIRQGIPNTYLKLKNKEKVKVAYFGGSITNNQGWRTYTDEWFSENYPGLVSSHNCAIGGTASDLGAIRFGFDVAPINPDLLFVEFAVNDDSIDEKHSVEAMEGIIRQAYSVNPKVDIVFVYTITNSLADRTVTGSLTPTAQRHEFIARQYNIPSVYMAYNVLSKYKNGEILIKQSDGEANDTRLAFSTDGVHPNMEGSKVYMEIMEPALEALFSDSNGYKATEVRNLPVELCAGNWNFNVYTPNEAELSAGFQEISTQDDYGEWSSRGEYIYCGGKGESIKFKINGSRVAFFYLSQAESPIIELYVDGKKVDEADLFDPWLGVMGKGTRHYVSPTFAEGEHEIEVKVSEKQSNKKKIIEDTGYNKDAYLKFYEENTERFENSVLSVGAIEIKGELIKE